MPRRVGFSPAIVWKEAARLVLLAVFPSKEHITDPVDRKRDVSGAGARVVTGKPPYDSSNSHIVRISPCSKMGKSYYSWILIVKKNVP